MFNDITLQYIDVVPRKLSQDTIKECTQARIQSSPMHAESNAAQYRAAYNCGRLDGIREAVHAFARAYSET